MKKTIDLNNQNTTRTWTADFDCYEFGRTLTPKQSSIFFRLGAEIGNNIARRMGFQPNVHRAHEYALWACETTEWKSIKAAKAIFAVAQQQGHFLS